MSEEPLDKQTIGDKFGLVGTTLDEILRKLRENELIVSISDGFTTTLFGTLLNEVYRTFDQRLMALATDGGDRPIMNAIETSS